MRADVASHVKKIKQTPEQRRKSNARSYAHVYRDLGRIKKEPCKVCGSLDSRMHHRDYSKPTVVEWLCRKHHLEWHAREKAQGIDRSITMPRQKPTEEDLKLREARKEEWIAFRKTYLFTQKKLAE